MRSRRSPSSCASPRRFPISASHSSSPSGSSRIDVAFILPPPQSGRTSRSSVRATQRRKIGASRERSATCSTRSMKTGSAHCRSSTTTTCGRSAARASRSRRNASCVSGGDVPITESGSTPIAIRISTSGQYVIPSPYERQRPRRTSAESPTRSRKSATRRDFPIPAGPSSVNEPARAARRRRPRSRARDGCARASRPTRGVSGWRASPSDVGENLEEARTRRRAPPSPSARAARPPRRGPRRGRGCCVSAPMSTSPGARRLLEPRGDVDRVAGDERLALAADDDLAGVDRRSAPRARARRSRRASPTRRERRAARRPRARPGSRRRP